MITAVSKTRYIMLVHATPSQQRDNIFHLK